MNFQPHPPRWSTKTSIACCRWKGVECNLTNHRVISIDVSGLLLGGVISPAINSLSELSEICLQKHVKIVYKPGNQLLRHNSEDNGRTRGIVIRSILGGALILITIMRVMVYVYLLRKSTMAYVENGRTEDFHKALISGDIGRDDSDFGTNVTR